MSDRRNRAMTNDDRRSLAPPSQSAPPGDETADVTWDDDTVPRLDDPSSDRITAIPEMPPELLAKRLMAEAIDEPASGTFQRPDSEAARSHATSSSTSTTAPPPAQRFPRIVQEPALEIDEGALDSAVAARGRWRRPPATQEEEPPQSLELDLSALERPAPPPDPKLRELTDRYSMGDYSGALSIAEAILEAEPGHPEALRCAKSCREILTSMYSARLGSLDQVVTVEVPREQIRWLSLDHRAGFLLSLVDGTLTLEELLDISGMPRLDALRIMFSLREERVITLGQR